MMKNGTCVPFFLLFVTERVKTVSVPGLLLIEGNYEQYPLFYGAILINKERK